MAMKLSVNEFLSLDGVMQGPGGPDEDRSGGFDRGGWVIPLFDADTGEIVDSWFERGTAILLGRTTYDLMSGYWSQVTDPDNEVAAALNGRPKYVASTTLTDPQWQNTTVLGDDALSAVADLKKQPGGELQVHGSCGLARQLHRAGLVDVYRLITFPVSVGQGKRLFEPGDPAYGYNVVASRTTSTGAMYAELQPKDYAVAAVAVEDGREVEA
jgi:dihydrofolate reductase